VVNNFVYTKVAGVKFTPGHRMRVKAYNRLKLNIGCQIFDWFHWKRVKHSALDKLLEYKKQEDWKYERLGPYEWWGKPNKEGMMNRTKNIMNWQAIESECRNYKIFSSNIILYGNKRNKHKTIACRHVYCMIKKRIYIIFSHDIECYNEIIWDYSHVTKFRGKLSDRKKTLSRFILVRFMAINVTSITP